MPRADADTEQSTHPWGPAAPPVCTQLTRGQAPQEAPPRVTAAPKDRNGSDSSPRAGRTTGARGIAPSRQEDGQQAQADRGSGCARQDAACSPARGPHMAWLMMRTDAGATGGLAVSSFLACWLFNGHSVKFSRGHTFWGLSSSNYENIKKTVFSRSRTKACFDCSTFTVTGTPLLVFS